MPPASSVIVSTSCVTGMPRVASPLSPRLTHMRVYPPPRGISLSHIRFILHSSSHILRTSGVTFSHVSGSSAASTTVELNATAAASVERVSTVFSLYVLSGSDFPPLLLHISPARQLNKNPAGWPRGF